MTGRPLAAYLLTKLAALVVLAAVTWWLAGRFGPRVWLGYLVVAAILGVLAATWSVALRGGLETGGRPRREGPPTGEEGGVGPPEEPVVLPVGDVLDLHPFAPADVPDVVRDWIEAAHAAGYRRVRLIHGKGIGVQRERVRALLARHPLVASFADAPLEAGGWGATVAVLRDGPAEKTG